MGFVPDAKLRGIEYEGYVRVGAHSFWFYMLGQIYSHINVCRTRSLPNYTEDVTRSPSPSCAVNSLSTLIDANGDGAGARHPDLRVYVIFEMRNATSPILLVTQKNNTKAGSAKRTYVFLIRLCPFILILAAAVGSDVRPLAMMLYSLRTGVISGLFCVKPGTIAYSLMKLALLSSFRAPLYSR